jgi:hypothetical protein
MEEFSKYGKAFIRPSTMYFTAAFRAVPTVELAEAFL